MTRKISLQRFSKRQVCAYIQDHNCSLDPSLNSRTPDNLLFVFNETYQCVNGKILAVSKSGTGNLYNSVNDWQTELEDLVNLGKREPVHILYNQLTNPEQFIKKIPSMISNLAGELEIAPHELDRTKESLLTLDQAIARKNRQSYVDSSSKKILGSLIAYVGEVIKVAVSGEWQIRQNGASGWEPVIISPNGTTSSFCIMVFDELYEAESSSFYDIALMLIEAHQQ